MRTSPGGGSPGRARAGRPRADVKPEGPVFREFVAAFTTPRIGEVLFQLVAERLDGTPTLTYEAEVTAQLRDQARSQVQEQYDTLPRATSSSSRTRRSARSSSSCFGWSTSRPTQSLSLGGAGPPGRGHSRPGRRALPLDGYYVHRHEPEIAGDLPRIATLCGLVVLSVASSGCWPSSPGTPSWSRWPSPP